MCEGPPRATPIMFAAGTKAESQFKALLERSSVQDLKMQNVDGRNVLDLLAKQTGTEQNGPVVARMRRVLERTMGVKGDPSLQSSAKRRLGISTSRQKYYLRGPYGGSHQAAGAWPGPKY